MKQGSVLRAARLRIGNVAVDVGQQRQQVDLVDADRRVDVRLLGVAGAAVLGIDDVLDGNRIEPGPDLAHVGIREHVAPAVIGRIPAAHRLLREGVEVAAERFGQVQVTVGLQLGRGELGVGVDRGSLRRVGVDLLHVFVAAGCKAEQAEPRKKYGVNAVSFHGCVYG